ncbi:hypothetical protein [Flavobacterium glaciei]|uniref:Anti-sigma-K factor rskA n=1 Tax=Flavobacterium glaciei TaxID=386300 RepID=A0A562Q281_9FLAO|nr:hypothetical protein [Flavobacterium glaciei]RDI57630.1 hypothetical protein DFR66_102253 [Flavobacterium glaciei]TWI50570.1 hypothetical protein IQ02_00465 [Flavobacterium glaciei]
MKTIKKAFVGTIALFLTSCASTAKFPVSSVTPAAEIVAKMKKDKNDNAVIVVTAKNLASADRLNPPKNNYVVWIVTEDNGTKNIGQLMNKNANKSVLTTSTPFKVKEIYITAEEQGNISYPSGIEISRTSF